MKFIKNSGLISVILSLTCAILLTPKNLVMGKSFYIIFVHVPTAWLALVFFIYSGILAIIALFIHKKRPASIEKINKKEYHAIVLGFIFCLIATISGSIWAKISWGSFWHNDPKQIGILILLFIYFSYLYLYRTLSVEKPNNIIISLYLVFAVATIPFIIFVLPATKNSLHPFNNVGSQSWLLYLIILNILAFSHFALSLYSLLKKIERKNHE